MALKRSFFHLTNPTQARAPVLHDKPHAKTPEKKIALSNHP
jgi:hypothetical protein